MKTAILCLFFCCTASSTAIAQLSQLEKHYPGGSEQFWIDFQGGFSFPSSTATAKTFGTTLIKINLNSDGVPATILFLNQIDIDVVKSITRAFTKISRNWSEFPSESELFISLTFSYGEDYREVIGIDKSRLTKDFAEFVYLVKTNDDTSINYKKDYLHLVKSAKKAYKKSNFKMAKQQYSRLIAIDPYQLDYYKRRIELEAFSGSKRYACTDIRVMKDFLNYKGAIPLHGCD